MNGNLRVDCLALANNWLKAGDAHANNKLTTIEKMQLHQDTADTVEKIRDMSIKDVKGLYRNFISSFSAASEQTCANLIRCLVENTFSDLKEKEGSYYFFANLISTLQTNGIEKDENQDNEVIGAHVLQKITTSAFKQIKHISQNRPLPNDDPLPDELLPSIPARKAILISHHLADKGWKELTKDLNMVRISNGGIKINDVPQYQSNSPRWIGMPKSALVYDLIEKICQELHLPEKNAEVLKLENQYVDYFNYSENQHKLTNCRQLLSSCPKQEETLNLTFHGKFWTQNKKSFYEGARQFSLRESKTYAILKDSHI